MLGTSPKVSGENPFPFWRYLSETTQEGEKHPQALSDQLSQLKLNTFTVVENSFLSHLSGSRTKVSKMKIGRSFHFFMSVLLRKAYTAERDKMGEMGKICLAYFSNAP